MTASDDYKARGSSGFTREEIDAAWMEHAQRDFADGEHEALWSAVKIVYDSNFPMPKWLYEAIITWLNRTETPRQKRARLQRVEDEARFVSVVDKVFDKNGRQVRKVDASFGIASDEMTEFGFAGSPAPGAVEDSYKKTRARLRRHEAARMKKVPK
jgi:hypothetical protein